MNDTNAGNGSCAIHMSLQGKGGVGKSLASSVLAQYFRARGRAVRCIDADPVNKTLFQYRALEAKPLQLLHDGAIDCRAFDQLMEELLTEEGPFIVDNGAACQRLFALALGTAMADKESCSNACRPKAYRNRQA